MSFGGVNIYLDEDRAARIAVYMLENDATVRQAGKAFGISKSTVHKDISVKLRKTDKQLYLQVLVLLEKNKRERHIRGGMATKMKYLSMKSVDKNTIML